MTDFLRDVRQSLRLLFQSPAFTVAALAALALGIGANTAVFSIANAVLLKPIPAPRADRMVQFMIDYGPISVPGGSPRGFYFWREQSGVVRDVSALRLELLNLTGRGEPRQLATARVSAGFFQLFGAAPSEGRLFTSDEDRPGGPRVAVLSHELWISRFGGDRAIIGRTITLSGEPYAVVGVLRPAFNSEQFDQRPDIWIPYQMDPASTDGSCYCRVLAQLQPGVTLASANAQLKVASLALRRQDPGTARSKVGFSVVSLRDAMVGDVRPLLWILLGAVAFVLLIACTNVANLALVRASARRRDIAVRAALGASRGRLIRQLLTESVILSLAGGIAGFAMSYWLASVVWTRNFATQVADANLRPDLHVLLVALGVAFLTGVGFGIAPALHITRTDVAATLKEGSFAPLRGYRRFGIRNLFVAYQVAASLALLFVAGFIVLGFAKVSQVNLGFDTTRLALFQLDPAHDGYSTRATADLYKQLPERLLRNPAVQGVTFAESVPFIAVFGALPKFHFYIAGEQGKLLRDADRQRVGARYFSTLGIAPLRGREFTDLDQSAASGAVPAILTQTGANEFFGQDGPIGRTFHDDNTTYTVVGVVPDQKSALVSAKLPAVVFVPFGASGFAAGGADVDLGSASAPPQSDTLIVRGKPGSNIIETVTSEIASLDPRLTVFNVSTVADRLHQVNTTVETSGSIYGGIGLFGLILSCIGLAGVTAYAVARRSKEIGIRVALGARRSQILGLVMKEGAILVLAGSVFGYFAAWAISHALSAITHEVADAFGSSAHDPRLLIGAPVLLAALALLACYLPARRAARIDPLTSLREQ
jgi:predicted permease